MLLVLPVVVGATLSLPLSARLSGQGALSLASSCIHVEYPLREAAYKKKYAQILCGAGCRFC